MRGKRIRRRNGDRSGASMVEFALILPLLTSVILGILEFGRAMQAVEVAVNAARVTARRAILPQSNDSAELTTRAETAFTNCALPVDGLTVTTKINGSEADISTADRGDEVTVEVAIPFSNVSLITPRFLGSFSVRGSATMRKE